MWRLTIFLVWTEAAIACSCRQSAPDCPPPWPPPSDQVIFVGTIEEVYPANPSGTYGAWRAAARSEEARRQAFWNLWSGKLEPGEIEQGQVGHFESPVRYTFGAKEILHGAESTRIEIFTGSGDADCSVRFAPGKAYLVFAYRVGKRWVTNTCTGTAAVADRSARLEQLRALRSGKEQGRRVVGFAYAENERGRPEIRLWSQTGFERRLRVKTDGWFDFLELPRGQYRLSADRPGWRILPNELVDLTTSRCEQRWLFPLKTP